MNPEALQVKTWMMEECTTSFHKENVLMKDIPDHVWEIYVEWNTGRNKLPQKELVDWGLVSHNWTVEPIQMADRDKYAEMKDNGYHVVPKLCNFYLQ